MKRLISGLVLPLTLFLAVGCSSDPTGDLRNGPSKLVTTPNQLFIEVGNTKTIEVGAVDDQGNPISASYEAAAAGGIVAVKRDSTFLPIFVNDSTLAVPVEGPRFRFIVTAVQYGATTITFQSAGLRTEVPVQVVPITTIDATVSNADPALGEEVTFTAPSGTKFTDSSAVTLPGAPTQPVTVSVAPDGSTITAIFPPNFASPVTLTNMFAVGAPSVAFSPATTVVIRTPVVDSVPAFLSTLTPNGGQAVTLTSTDPAFRFDASTVVSVGATAGITTGVAGDGSSVTFMVIPGASGAPIVSGVIVGGIAVTLPSQGGTLAVGATVAPIGGTGDPGTAPPIETPGIGLTRGVIDNGTTVGYASCGDIGLPCQVYKLVVPEDGSFDFEATWQGTSDVGIYFFESDGATLTGNSDCDSHGNGATAQPETCTQALTVGTYYMAFVPFGPFYTPAEPNPDWFQVTVTRTE